MKKNRQHPYPSRVRVLVIGGGIHGVGTLHDLASRSWKDILLVEKTEIGAGTSRKSTKLIHGGLRYLKNPFDYGLVYEGLKERRLLMQLLPDLVQPIELLFPVLKAKGMPSWMIRSGLYLYDFMSGKQKIDKHCRVTLKQASEKIPGLNTDQMKTVFSFWDGQTDDLQLTRAVAHSAQSLGAQIQEQTTVEKIFPDKHGWLVTVASSDGSKHDISCKYLVNAAGPWANKLLEQSNIKPKFSAINVKGSHILLPNLGLRAGIFLQAKKDHREMFLLPWKDKTLLGTTELLYKENLDHISVSEAEINYMLETANLYLHDKLTAASIETVFSGLRWLAVDSNKSLHATSRTHKISEHQSQSGIIYTIYGGKLTAYRSLSEEIGSKILKDFGDDTPSKTDTATAWIFKDKYKFNLSEDLQKRF